MISLNFIHQLVCPSNTDSINEQATMCLDEPFLKKSNAEQTIQ
jgi:hypothetical protein